jgi:peroxiredoxin
MALEAGIKAPDFSLPAGPGPDRVTLSSFRGDTNVVVLFFPMAFSSVCTDEMCQMAEDHSRWAELDAQVLGVSVDSPFVVQKFRQETGAPFPILSDFNKKAIYAYDVVYDDFFGAHGVGKRSAFVIDREGVIRYAWVTEDSGVLPDFEEIRRVVQDLD